MGKLIADHQDGLSCLHIDLPDTTQRPTLKQKLCGRL
jgi:hypothetical protein